MNRWWTVVLGIGLLAALCWAYWPSLGLMINRWTYDPRYAHGYLVPIFAVFLLWRDRGRLGSIRFTSSRWWGIAVLLLGCATHVAGGVLHNDWLALMSVLPSLGGVVLLWGGWTALRWAAPAIAYLAFMVPLPYRVEIALGWPLQRLATSASVYLLQTQGLAAVGEGNVIVLDHGRIGVVEACSGLSMMLLFVALSTGVAILVRRPWTDRLLLVLSAIPIALVVNILRITVTGVLNETVGGRVAQVVYHDLAGWLMMPTALLLMGLELWLLDRLLIEDGLGGSMVSPREGRTGRFGPIKPTLTRP
jgi:exosortase